MKQGIAIWKILGGLNMNETKRLIRFLVFLFAPFALIFAGAGLTSLGFGNDIAWLGWTGVIVVGVGL